MLNSRNVKNAKSETNMKNISQKNKLQSIPTLKRRSESFNELPQTRNGKNNNTKRTSHFFSGLTNSIKNMVSPKLRAMNHEKNFDNMSELKFQKRRSIRNLFPDDSKKREPDTSCRTSFVTICFFFCVQKLRHMCLFVVYL